MKVINNNAYRVHVLSVVSSGRCSPELQNVVHFAIFLCPDIVYFPPVVPECTVDIPAKYLGALVTCSVTFVPMPFAVYELLQRVLHSAGRLPSFPMIDGPPRPSLPKTAPCFEIGSRPSCRIDYRGCRKGRKSLWKQKECEFSPHATNIENIPKAGCTAVCAANQATSSAGDEDLKFGYETDAGIREYKSQAERMNKDQRERAGFKRITLRRRRKQRELGPSTPHTITHETVDEEVAEVVFFEYGVAVFFGLTEEQEKGILEDIEGTGVVRRKIAEEDWEVEACHFTVCTPSSLGNGIPKQLATSGALQLRRHEALKLTGSLFKLRRDVNLVSNVLDVPELFWSEASLKELYDAVRDYMEIKPRVQVLNEKLGVASDFGEVIARLVVHATLNPSHPIRTLSRDEALQTLERMMVHPEHAAQSRNCKTCIFRTSGGQD
ncbi:DUF155 domain-containing protein [Salix suchowensis]|nr:DUF155 domain-containing protein [Salix suchowensis]